MFYYLESVNQNGGGPLIKQLLLHQVMSKAIYQSCCTAEGSIH